MQEQLIRHITVGDIATNCWIYGIESPAGADSRLCAVIDPGAEADRIIESLRRLNMRPLYILLTHGHFDHIAALPALAAAYTPRPIIAVHRLDAEYFGPASLEVHRRSFAAAAGNSSYVDALWEDMPSPDRLLEEGEKIGPFTVLHLPGHTRGSAVFYDRAEDVLFSGDTLFRGDYGRTDLPGGNDGQIRESLKRLLAMESAVKVYPGHGPVTAIGEETGLLEAI